jgi:hypothetical protein
MGMAGLWTAVKAVGLLFTLFYRPRNKSGSTEDSSKTPGDLQIQGSQIGGKIPVVLGRRKLAGNLIWYDNFQVHEHYQEQEVQEGGKGGSSKTESVFSHYTYSVSFAFGVCLGEAEIFKIWQGENEIPISQWSDLGITTYTGTTTQTANAHISSFVPRAPAYRNLCYVVFENYSLGQSTYLPNFTFEVTVDSDAYWGDIYQRKWGSYGSGEGEFEEHIPSIIIHNGEVYVCDMYNNRIQVFDLVGTYKRSIGSYGSGDGELEHPTSIYIYNDELYVNDSRNWRVQVFNLQGEFKRKWGSYGSGEGEFFHNLGITVNNDIVYIVDCGNNRIQTFDLEGNFQGLFGTFDNGTIHYFYYTDICFCNGEAYVLEPYNCKINVFDSNGSFQRTWGSSGSGEGELSYPMGMCIYDDLVYVADSNNNRIQVFNTSGVYQRQWGSYGSGNGELCNPESIYIYNDEAYVSDSDNSRIQVFKYMYVPPSTIDITPPEIARTILTNDLYGMGIDSDDLGSFTDAIDFCTTNDIKISILLDSEMSTLDLLEHLCSYHNGYITYSGGKLSYKQVETESPVTNINVDTDVVKSESPLEMTRESSREVRNRIKVKYTKRANKYTSGIVVAEDEVNQEENGIQELEVSMSGFTTGARAMKLAYTILRRSLAMPMKYSFTIGPKKATLLTPGAVFTLTDSQLGISAKPLRVLSTSENKNGTIAIEATEEIGYIMDSKSAPSDDYYISPDRLDDPYNVRYPILSELPALIAQDNNYVISNFAGSGEDSWLGATIYDSFDGDSYTKKYTSVGSGLMGKIDSITNDSITITVTDEDTTLNSKDDVFALLQDLNFNACYDSTANKYFRFGTATLVAAGQWKLEGIIWDCYDTPNLTHSASVGDTISLMKYKQLPTYIEYDIARKDSNIYYKFVSYNYGGVPQDIAYVDVKSIEFKAKGSAPVAPKNLEVDGLGSITKVPSGDIDFKWHTCNRKDRGLDYTRSDQLTEDTDFVRFDITITDEDTDTVLRTTNVTDTTWTYTSAMQSTDGNPSNIKIEVEKVSEINRSEKTSLTIEIV